MSEQLTPDRQLVWRNRQLTGWLGLAGRERAYPLRRR